MSKFTYEKQNVVSKLETFERDNTWFEHTENGTAERML